MITSCFAQSPSKAFQESEIINMHLYKYNDADKTYVKGDAPLGSLTFRLEIFEIRSKDNTINIKGRTLERYSTPIIPCDSVIICVISELENGNYLRTKKLFVSDQNGDFSITIKFSKGDLLVFDNGQYHLMNIYDLDKLSKSLNN